jgi:acetylornithine deacetylase/succinyl-diaminopimelate desuccinylase-like protein
MTRWSSFSMPVLVLTVAILADAPSVAAQTLPPDEYRDLAREILRELVEINTTHSVGNTTLAAEAMAARLRSAGFPEEDLFVGGPRADRGNLVARYRGSDPSLEPILALAHIDVVEADPDDWTVDPFTLLERDGYFYGRGVLDNKDEAAIYVTNLIRMKREGFVPDRDIIVALTADEEGGPDNGVVWLLEHHRGLVDAAFVLNEGGGGSIVDGRHVSNNVQASEKKYLNFTFEARNPGGHSSLPVRKNAIYDLSGALLAVQSHAFSVRLNEVTRAYFGRTADIVGGAEGDAMRRVVADQRDEGAIAVLAREPGYDARLRTTCVATQLAGGHAPNALPQSARATVNCRLLPDEDPAVVLRTLQDLATPFDVGVTAAGSATESPASPLTPEIMGPIEAITEQMWPGVPVVPIMSTGATDALYFRNAGIPVYGVSGIFHDIADNRSHGQDERIGVTAFYEAAEFLYRLVKEYANVGSDDTVR